MSSIGQVALPAQHRQGEPLQLHGCIPPVITPLNSDGSLDGASLQKQLRRMLDEGVHGFFMLGTAGEGAMIPPDVAVQVVQATTSFSAGQVPVLAGVIEASPDRAIAAARSAAKAGADAVVVAGPYYFMHDEAALLHIQKVLAAVDVPVVLYNIPQLTRNKMRVEDVAAVANRIIAIKDSSGDMEHVARLLQIPGLRLFQGAEPQMAATMAMGAAGVVAGLSNISPRLFVQLYEAGAAGDAQKATELQATVNDLRAYNQGGYWLAALKTAVSMLGCAQPYTAFPVPPIDEVGKAHICSVLERHGLL